MSKDYTAYLLRTSVQIADFRARYAGYIRSQSSAYVKWILSWPPRVWIDFLQGVPSVNIPVVIGIICLLYIDRRIDIDFNESASKIRRWWTPEEWQDCWTYKPRRKLK